MKINVAFTGTDSRAPRQESAFWRRWKVDGVTAINHLLTEASITVTQGIDGDWGETGAPGAVLAHETGHALTAQGVADNGGDGDAYAQYDQWQGEVEAWVRGMEDGDRLFTWDTGRLALDALNTYRRSLGVSDDDWFAAKRVIADIAIDLNTTADLLAYTPLEPDPNDPSPENHFDPERGWDQPHEEDYDYDDYEEPEAAPEGDDETRGGDMRPSSYDSGWSNIGVVEALQEGFSAEFVAERFGLDLSRMSPLAKAIVKIAKEDRR